MDSEAQLAGSQFGREITQGVFSGKLSRIEMFAGELYSEKNLEGIVDGCSGDNVRIPCRVTSLSMCIVVAKLGHTG